MASPQVEDAILVGRSQKGDAEALNVLIQRYQLRAYQFAYRLTGDADDASDLAAEAFVRVFNAMPRFRGESSFSTWLFRIITNCFLDIRKKEKGRKPESMDELLQGADSELSRQYSGDEDSPAESSERFERARVMHAVIQQLPEYQRAMIVMYHVEMLSYEDIAGALAMPIGTVKSRLNRARLALRELLEPYAELFT